MEKFQIGDKVRIKKKYIISPQSRLANTIFTVKKHSF